LNRIPHPWTLLGSVLAYPSHDSSLLELKVLIPLWTRTPSQFKLVSSIFFFNSSGQLTWVTFTLSAYLIGLPESRPNSLPELHLSALPKPYPITSMLTRPYTFIPGRITLPNSSPDQTSTYPALHDLTRSNYLTQSFSRSDFYLPGLTRSYSAGLPYPILLPVGLLLTRPYTVLPGRITLPDRSPEWTSTYSTLHSLTRLNYLTRSLPDQTSGYPIILGHLTRLPYHAG
jgi:hypothetical protein